MEKMINLETFAEGALAEKVNMALKEVLGNITDPNTDYKTKRKLTLDITFTAGVTYYDRYIEPNLKKEG